MQKDKTEKFTNGVWSSSVGFRLCFKSYMWCNTALLCQTCILHKEDNEALHCMWLVSYFDEVTWLLPSYHAST